MKLRLPGFKGIRQRVGSMGFEGPEYRGFAGKVKFLWESTVFRTEVVFVLSADRLLEQRYSGAGEFSLLPVDTPDEAARWATHFDRVYYDGYFERWCSGFGWAHAVVGCVDGEPVSYNWYQRGTREGYPTYYGHFFADEGRILRGAVFPKWRRLGLNKVMKHALLKRMIDGGCRRIYAECYENNVPSVRTLVGLGFQPLRRLQVIGFIPGGGAFRWKRIAGDLADQLGRSG